MVHLKFCGIELRGSFSEIMSKFRDTGFDIASNKDREEVCMSGILYNEKCNVKMYYSIEYGGFYHIAIHLIRQYYSWELLSGKFYQIKEEMEDYYGRPPILFDSFSRKFKRGNNNEMKYLDDVNFMATFHLPLFYADVVICKDATINIRIHDNIYDETICKNRPDLITEMYKTYKA